MRNIRVCGLWIAGIAIGVLIMPMLSQAQSCAVRSGDRIAPVVELYTSEGCNSCPPADRWLSRLKSHGDIIALAFHVDYWDRLGWKDRFASAAFSDRQAREQRRNGASFSYTPQIVLNGRDYKRWHRSSAPTDLRSNGAAAVEISLVKSEANYVATVIPGAKAPSRLAAYWAITENDHSSAVTAGENKGERLVHDFVVREYRPVAPWRTQGAATLRLEPRRAIDAAHPTRVNLVVIDGDTGQPVQAVGLGCEG